MPEHKVTTDIQYREKIFIDPNNGERRTKLKGGERIPDAGDRPTEKGSTNDNQEGQSGGSSQQQNTEGEERKALTEDKKSEGISIEPGSTRMLTTNEMNFFKQKGISIENTKSESLQVAKCPVCEGTGEVNRTLPTASEIYIEKCNGCNGKGWVKL